MNRALLKAAAKKMNYKKTQEPDFSDDDSNASLTSDDEEEVYNPNTPKKGMTRINVRKNKW